MFVTNSPIVSLMELLIMTLIPPSRRRVLFKMISKAFKHSNLLTTQARGAALLPQSMVMASFRSTREIIRIAYIA